MSTSSNSTNSFSIGLSRSLTNQAPDLGPSIAFTVLFGISSMLYAYRSYKHRRLAYYYLFGFTILRTATYISRAVWSQDKSSSTDAIVGGVIAAGGFFLAAQSLYVLFTVWVAKLFGGLDNLPRGVQMRVRLLKILLPLSSIIGIVGAVKQFSATSIDDYNFGTAMRKASILGFAILLVLLMFSTILYTVLKGRGHNNVTVVLILCIGSLLLMVELIYRIISLWSDSTADVNTKKWVFYVFLSIPEFLFCAFMGIANLEKVFYTDASANDIDSEKGGN
ncbi:16345_t:CDS:1 [Acaulospora colombiana]|uniref:16345_t:CDS:1 n=1 Tax=Acaulospora colombiana TaxID=27376 RepID=A0ACA9M2D3_9GLOM|nr:16345_t:CDS:1 [Acaulospora colombiana]